jgi:CheY-like chemotaxis protein
MNGRPRVLVIDNDKALGKVIGRAVRKYDPVVVTRATAALGRIAAGARFDAILCDLMIPGVSCAEFYERVVSTPPSLRARPWAGSPRRS